MYDIIQIGTKVIIIAIIFLIAIFMSYKVWRADLDINKLFSPRHAVERTVDDKLSWLPTREKDAIYQNENIVARTTGEIINLNDGTVEFQEIYQSDKLIFDSEFDFQKWRLKIFHVEEMIGFSNKGRLLHKVKCKIVGERGTKE